MTIKDYFSDSNMQRDKTKRILYIIFNANDLMIKFGFTRKKLTSKIGPQTDYIARRLVNTYTFKWNDYKEQMEQICLNSNLHPITRSLYQADSKSEYLKVRSLLIENVNYQIKSCIMM